MPTTEVAIRSRPKEDVYVIMSTVDPKTKRATFRVILRPLVAWIWIGGLVLLFGALIAVWPTARDLVDRGRSSLGVALLAASLALGGLTSPAAAQSDGSSSLHAGSVTMHNPVERKLFAHLLCQCGDCARLALDSCGCGWAENARAEIREELSAGKSVEQIEADYLARYGAKSLAVPGDKGMDRALWLVPILLMVIAVIGIVLLGRRWRSLAPQRDGEAASDSDYQAKIDRELERLEREG